VEGRQKLHIKRLNEGIKIKQMHFNHIYEYCRENNLEIAMRAYASQLEEINSLKTILNNKEFQNRYIKVINKNLKKIYQGWWSEIISIKQLMDYEDTIN